MSGGLAVQERCACGRPLHYSDPTIEGWFEREVEVVIFERVPFDLAERIEKECIRVERPRYNLRLA